MQKPVVLSVKLKDLETVHSFKISELFHPEKEKY